MYTQNAVACQIKCEEQPSTMPVLRNVSDPSAFAPPGVKIIDRGTLKQHLAAGSFAKTSQNLNQFRLPVAFDTGNPEGFATTHFKREVIEN